MRTEVRGIALLIVAGCIARMLRAHEELLMNWFRAKGEISGGAVEGLNKRLE
jgi:hypothetical protein